MSSKRPRRRRAGWFSTFLALLVLAFAVLTIVVRARPLSNNIELLVAVSAPYAAVAAVVVLAFSLIFRRIVMSLLAVAVSAAALAFQVPWYYFGHPADVGPHFDLRVLSANLRDGEADAPSFVELARANADVITVSELTPEAVQRFAAAGIEAEFPYSVLVPAPGAGGVGLYSRFPIEKVSPGRFWKRGTVAARLQIPGVRVDPMVASVHITSPVARYGKTFNNWRTGIVAAKSQLSSFANITGPGSVIIAGDFNSTPDMRQFRDLLTGGYRDSVEQTGAGFAPTFPSHTWCPPLITIDHVLTRNAAASSIRTIYVRGSDHRALLADIDVPLDGVAPEER